MTPAASRRPPLGALTAAEPAGADRAHLAADRTILWIRVYGWADQAAADALDAENTGSRHNRLGVVTRRAAAAQREVTR